MRIYRSVIIQSGLFCFVLHQSFINTLLFLLLSTFKHSLCTYNLPSLCFLPQPVPSPLLSPPLSRPLLFPWQYLFMAALAWFQFRIPMINFSQWTNVCTLKVHVDILAAHFYSVFTLASYNSQINTWMINSYS